MTKVLHYIIFLLIENSTKSKGLLRQCSEKQLNNIEQEHLDCSHRLKSEKFKNSIRNMEESSALCMFVETSVINCTEIYKICLDEEKMWKLRLTFLDRFSGIHRLHRLSIHDRFRELNAEKFPNVTNLIRNCPIYKKYKGNYVKSDKELLKFWSCMSLNETDDSVLLKFGICKKNIEYILAQTSEEGNQKEMCQLKRRLYPMMYKCIPDNFEKRKTDCWENMLIDDVQELSAKYENVCSEEDTHQFTLLVTLSPILILCLFFCYLSKDFIVSCFKKISPNTQ